MYEEITNLIGTVGFPIIAFIMMFYFCKSVIDENTKSINDLKESIDKLCDSIQK